MITYIICKSTFKLKLHLSDLVISQSFLAFLWNDFCVISVTCSTKCHFNYRFFCYPSGLSIATFPPEITKLFNQCRYLKAILYIHASGIVELQYNEFGQE